MHEGTSWARRNCGAQESRDWSGWQDWGDWRRSGWSWGERGEGGERGERAARGLPSIWETSEEGGCNAEEGARWWDSCKRRYEHEHRGAEPEAGDARAAAEGGRRGAGAAEEQGTPPGLPRHGERQLVRTPAEAAAAHVAAGNLPAAVLDEGRVYGVDYFLSYEDFTDSWSAHNAALKWFREMQEAPANPRGSPPHVFDPDVKAAIAAIVPHVKGSGQDWEFNRDVMVAWDWKELVAQLRDEDLREIVTGAGGQSRGLIGCELAVRPNSYDHIRQARLRQKGQATTEIVPMWDFVLHRDDGTGVRVHPRRTTKDMEVCEVWGHLSQVQTPWNGLGRSDGRGTYRWYKNIGVSKKVRFDHNKVPPHMRLEKGKGKDKGKDKGKKK